MTATQERRMCGGGGPRCRSRRQAKHTHRSRFVVTPPTSARAVVRLSRQGAPCRQGGQMWPQKGGPSWRRVAASGSRAAAAAPHRLAALTCGAPRGAQGDQQGRKGEPRHCRDRGKLQALGLLARRSAGQPVGWVRASAAGEQGGKGRQDGRSTGASAARFDAGEQPSGTAPC